MLILQQKCLLVQQKCPPLLVSMQCARYQDYRGLQKESLSFPQKPVLKNTVASGGCRLYFLHKLRASQGLPDLFWGQTNTKNGFPKTED